MTWLVVVTPQKWSSAQRCTGDVLEIDSHTGELKGWNQLNYQRQDRVSP
jgi:hypothetical protein